MSSSDNYRIVLGAIVYRMLSFASVDAYVFVTFFLVVIVLVWMAL